MAGFLQPKWMYGQAAEPEAKAEPKLFAGTLQGYRHFRVKPVSDRFGYTDSYVIASPAYAFPWGDGENKADCSHLHNMDDDLLERRLSETRGGIDRYERELEDAMAALRGQRFRGMPSSWDVELSGDGYRFTIGVEGRRQSLDEVLQQLRDYLCRLEATKVERVRFDRGEHSLKSCTCGFYASFDPKTDFYSTTTDQHVHAVVEAYRKIVVGTRGFRAQKLKVVALAPFHRGPVRKVTYDRAFFADDYGSYTIHTVDCERLPVADMRFAAATQFPSARWFDDHGAMLKAFPEPDRSGLVADNDSDYGV